MKLVECCIHMCGKWAVDYNWLHMYDYMYHITICYTHRYTYIYIYNYINSRSTKHVEVDIYTRITSNKAWEIPHCQQLVSDTQRVGGPWRAAHVSIWMMILQATGFRLSYSRGKYQLDFWRCLKRCAGGLGRLEAESMKTQDWENPCWLVQKTKWVVSHALNSQGAVFSKVYNVSITRVRNVS